MPYDPMDAAYLGTDPSVPNGVPADPKATASTSMQMGAGEMFPTGVTPGTGNAPPVPPSKSIVEFQQQRNAQDAQDRESMKNAFINSMVQKAIDRYAPKDTPDAGMSTSGGGSTGGLPGLGSIPGIGSAGDSGGSASSSISFGGEAP